MLEFNYDTINAKIYRWFWNIKKMPNLCPYFWKSILMWLIIPFVFLICLPDILFSLINKEKINNINYILDF